MMMWKPSLFDDSDGEVTPVCSDESSPYLLDDLDVFESCLSSMSSIDSGKGNPVTPLTPVTVKSSFDVNETLVDGVGSIGDLIHHRGGGNSSNLTDTDDDEYFTSSSSPSRTPLKAQPWDGCISWKHTSMKKSNGKCEGSPFLSRPGHSSDFLTHGLVYVPRIDDRDAYRTVYLTHLPLDVDMKTLLSAIRGGIVYSAHIMNMEEAAGYHMGVVTFVRGQDAAAYVNFAAMHGVYFNDDRVNVSLSKTPTYPISKMMQQNIFDQLYTRCLVICGDRDPRRYTYIAWHLKAKMPTDFGMGDRMTENNAETEINIRFSSIRAADCAYEILRGLLRDCTNRFALDPCAQPLPSVEGEKKAKEFVPTIELACSGPWM
ncbi:uncharacterized protein GIQ15_03068 [Arthroderma uncinatum]|uniref:uncharacterized protein n=1 Tax=Arthroderma uncinatum TaxID=74035 RepID=UPI00144A70EE|nr:uncharacterized protein GIQ15_03068 [Arthroderma uncinatum]KAF3483744.1 hypothetical protein GIQ15_03068 [Arthroderma uncinatum]